ncbi:YeeE/YedE family protein [Duganella sp. sic0402]|uniref:DUF6691 family protein n=1 Tax=Duganella sp. sic0402 TaxID=2854786 RepID=UPI001C479B6B|nr:DUF6691 family protein [Duganella sp. sic0402]MBV7536738.1 YeeE/YedE family protein [Duganella sp. sic0402]
MVILSLLAGLIFGFGLIVSGMANPANVLAFLRGTDLSLAWVMAGAIGTSFFAFRWAKKHRNTLLPTATRIDRPLIIGAAMFGAGWGLAGLCPGPALVGLGMGVPKAVLFVAAMLAGMGLFELRRKYAARFTSNKTDT